MAMAPMAGKVAMSRLSIRASSVASQPKSPLVLVKKQVLHSNTPHQLDVVRSLSAHVTAKVMPLLRPVSTCWQPSDFLPASEDPHFLEKVRDLRARTAQLPDEYLVVFVGDLLTEEALPTYMAMLNTLDVVRDETGVSQTPWARWTREWTAEENRHGDVMNKYMYLTGRVNMKALDVTLQKLVGSGMDPQTENNPYLGFIYTSFQERATKISHGATARHAKEHGDDVLAKICGAIAQDEGRHEQAYQRIVDELFVRDPSGAMLAFADMMKKQIVMPAHMMDDNEHTAKTGRSLFADFSTVAERTGTYTAHDYASIVEHLTARWDVANLQATLSGDAAAAQEYVIRLPNRIRKLAERSSARKSKAPVLAPFSWIFDREVSLV